MQGFARLIAPLVEPVARLGRNIAQRAGMPVPSGSAATLALVVASAMFVGDVTCVSATSATVQTPTSPTGQPPAAPPVETAAQPAPPVPPTGAVVPKGLEGLGLQVALDRAGFSPGVIDGRPGRNTRAALTRYQEARKLPPSGTLDDATRQALGAPPAIVAYTLTPDDVAGPYVARIPDDMMEKRTLEVLTYTSAAEMLAERFHTMPQLLARLNPKLAWQAGQTLQVPNVEPFLPPGQTETRKVNPPAADQTADVRVSKAAGVLTVRGTDGSVRFSAPVTSGSEHDPLPIGTWKVTAVYLRPVFNYNPDLFWDADPAHGKARLPAGPNNPVGLVWIDLDKEHYGLHGTPEPSRIGVSQSHGCVRLTNWDALKVASLVKTGTPVIFEP